MLWTGPPRRAARPRGRRSGVDPSRVPGGRRARSGVGLRSDHVDRLTAAGASVLRVDDGHHVTMADPEGNEFDICWYAMRRLTTSVAAMGRRAQPIGPSILSIRSRMSGTASNTVNSTRAPGSVLTGAACRRATASSLRRFGFGRLLRPNQTAPLVSVVGQSHRYQSRIPDLRSIVRLMTLRIDVRTLTHSA